MRSVHTCIPRIGHSWETIIDSSAVFTFRGYRKSDSGSRIVAGPSSIKKLGGWGVGGGAWGVGGDLKIELLVKFDLSRPGSDDSLESWGFRVIRYGVEV